MMHSDDYFIQDVFDQTIGRLDYVLSKLVLWGKAPDLELANRQTLKHHAEDMIAAGEKILKDLGQHVEGTPQPNACGGDKPIDDEPNLSESQNEELRKSNDDLKKQLSRAQETEARGRGRARDSLS